jgi:hypothetical protein
MILIPVLALSAVVASIVAISKHGSLKAAIASAKREGANLEALVAKAEVAAKADILAIAARLKSIL